MPPFPEHYDLFVFDLDGTLADTRQDLRASVNRALSALGLPGLSLEEVTRYVGDGARVLIERALGPKRTVEAVEQGLQAFLDDYRATCAQTTMLYPGVRPALEGLRAKNLAKDLAVLTNKPIFPTQKILAAHGLEDFFQAVVGGDSIAQKKPHPAGLRKIAGELGHPLERTLLIGDSAIDIETARAAGARAAFVKYGFRPDDWREAAPDHLLDSLLDLLGEVSPRG
jgi:phosphoglycolate phosphatase